MGEDMHSGFDRTYSLLEISQMLGRPRETLKSWYDLFREFIPVIGEGRTRRYKREAIEIFSLIGQMKEHNEPNELIRTTLRQNVREIVVYEDPAEKPFLAEDLALRYEKLTDEMDAIKEGMVMMYQQMQTLTQQVEQVVQTGLAMQEVAASTESLRDQMEQFQSGVEGRLESVHGEVGEIKSQLEHIESSRDSADQQLQEAIALASKQYWSEVQKQTEEREQVERERQEKADRDIHAKLDSVMKAISENQPKKKGFFGLFGR